MGECVLLDNIIIIVFSTLLLVIGWLIWKNPRVEFIKYWKRQDIKDILGYCVAMGKTIFFMGGFLLFSTILGFVWDKDIAIGVIFTGMIILLINSFIITKKYTNKLI